MTASRLLALALAASALSCASSPVALRRTARVGDAEARLHVPETFEPLAPGSVYPNRRMPVPAEGRPGVLLWPDASSGRTERSLAVTFLAERGIVVLELPPGGPSGPPAAALRDAVAAFGAFRESRGAPVAVLAFRPGPGVVEAVLDETALSAAAFLGFDPPAARAVRGAGRLPVLVATLHAGPGEASELSRRLTAFLGRSPVERRYLEAPDGGFPPEAARDVAEWLAAVLAEGAPGR